MNTSALTTILATVGLLASTAGTLAESANATTALNVRTGPGASFAVLDTLLPGESVEVTECASNGWCRIEHPGPDGWVSSKYLAADLDGTGPASESTEDPEINFGFGVDSNGNFSFGFGIGDNPIIQTPPVADPDAVCFYKKANFQGESFCVSPGASDNKLSMNWDNKISSIKLIGNTSVKVCRKINYGGLCKTWDSSKPFVGTQLNNKVTSFKAY